MGSCIVKRARGDRVVGLVVPCVVASVVTGVVASVVPGVVG